MFPKNQALRKFVFARTYQLRHVNGLTFDFLYEMAKKLHDSNSMMLLGGGEKGNAPLASKFMTCSQKKNLKKTILSVHSQLYIF